MKFCEYCQRNVKPKKDWSWLGFCIGLGLFYIPWYFWKAPHCPICNAKMGILKKD